MVALHSLLISQKARGCQQRLPQNLLALFPLACPCRPACLWQSRKLTLSVPPCGRVCVSLLGHLPWDTFTPEAAGPQGWPVEAWSSPHAGVLMAPAAAPPPPPAAGRALEPLCIGVRLQYFSAAYNSVDKNVRFVTSVFKFILRTSQLEK